MKHRRTKDHAPIHTWQTARKEETDCIAQARWILLQAFECTAHEFGKYVGQLRSQNARIRAPWTNAHPQPEYYHDEDDVAPHPNRRGCYCDDAGICRNCVTVAHRRAAAKLKWEQAEQGRAICHAISRIFTGPKGGARETVAR